MTTRYRFRRGQTAWVRSLQEILNTLDSEGELDGLPFMPEMIRHCGRPFQVSHLARRACVEGHGFRGMTGTVFLEDLRCDGTSHDDCQRGCLLFWKEAWLSDKPPTQLADSDAESPLLAGARLNTMRGERFFCQSTELAGATTDLKRGNLLHYLGDVWLGEMGVAQFMSRAVKSVLNRLRRLAGVDTSNLLRGHNRKTDTARLDLRPGDWVEVKVRREVEATLDAEGRNRGLLFDCVMLAHCGQRYRVADTLQKIIQEESGRMVPLRNTVILDGVTCQRPGCYRANLLYWREIWLKRVAPPTDDGAPGPPTLEASVNRKVPESSLGTNDSQWRRDLRPATRPCSIR